MSSPAPDVSQAFSRATRDAATQLPDLVGGNELSEKRLVAAFVAGLEAQGLLTETGVHLPVPDWNPKPGGTDILVGPRDAPVALAELKVSRPRGQPALFEALWDLFKLAAQVGKAAAGEPLLGSVQGAFLVTAAPSDHWIGHPRATWHVQARELFPASEGELFEDDSHALFQRNHCAWEDLLWGGRARPTRIGKRIATEGIATVRFDHGSTSWEIRCARVLPRDDEWLPFRGEWPAGDGDRLGQ